METSSMPKTRSHAAEGKENIAEIGSNLLEDESGWQWKIEFKSTTALIPIKIFIIQATH